MAASNKSGAKKLTSSDTGSLISACKNCPNTATSSSSSVNGFSDSQVFIEALGQLHNLQKEVNDIKNNNKKVIAFYESTAELNKTVKIVVIILMIIPIIQLILCTGMVYYLGIQDELPELLNWLLSGISILSLAELVIGCIRFFMLEKRVDDFEKKLEKLSPASDQ